MPPANTLPCLWSRLRKHVGRTRSKSGSKIHVNDSKQVYSPSVGVRELERAVLSFISASGDWPASLNDLLARLAPHCLKELAEHAWYAEPVEKEKFPLTQEAMPIRLFAKSLAVEMAQSRTRCVYLAARVLSERPYNRIVNATRNKASVLFTQGAHHLDYLIRTFAGQDLHIFCDRQGGRSRYGSLLRMLFEDWSLEILHEEDGRSDYALHRSGRIVHITWAEKAEAQCLPAAMASMIAKYLREALMHRFNAYWAEAERGVSPTAGYYTDGLRFLRDIAASLYPDRFDFARFEPPVLTAQAYWQMLQPLGAVQAWETEYLQRLDPVEGMHPVHAFTQSTAMRPFVEKMTAPEAATYAAAYDQALASAYPLAVDGSCLMPFRRVFFTLKV